MIKTFKFVVCLLAAAALLALCSACGEAGPSIGQDELLSRMESSSPPLLLDVRSTGEFRNGHVPGAVNVPYDELPARLEELDEARDREVVVYCESGRRAGLAEQTLREAGFSQVIHLEGDMSGWRRKALPTMRP